MQRAGVVETYRKRAAIARAEDLDRIILAERSAGAGGVRSWPTGPSADASTKDCSCRDPRRQP
jgi:hypothetical protein